MIMLLMFAGVFGVFIYLDKRQRKIYGVNNLTIAILALSIPLGVNWITFEVVDGVADLEVTNELQWSYEMIEYDGQYVQEKVNKNGDKSMILLLKSNSDEELTDKGFIEIKEKDTVINGDIGYLQGEIDDTDDEMLVTGTTEIQTRVTLSRFEDEYSWWVKLLFLSESKGYTYVIDVIRYKEYKVGNDGGTIEL